MDRQGGGTRCFRDQQPGYLGVFVDVDLGSPGSVKGEGIGQGVLGVYGVQASKEGTWGVRVPVVNSLKDGGVLGNQQHLVGGRFNGGLYVQRLKTKYFIKWDYVQRRD